MLVEPGTTGYTLFKFVGTAVIHSNQSVYWRDGRKFEPEEHMVLKFLSKDVFEVYRKTEELIEIEKSGKFKSYFEQDVRTAESKLVRNVEVEVRKLT